MLMRTAALKRLSLALAGLALSAGVLPLSATAAPAQSGPFTALAGSWSGGGTITLSDGSRERLRCRANYSPQGANQLSLSLRCAGDSYNFEFSGSARYSAGTITGNWSESTWARPATSSAGPAATASAPGPRARTSPHRSASRRAAIISRSRSAPREASFRVSRLVLAGDSDRLPGPC